MMARPRTSPFKLGSIGSPARMTEAGIAVTFAWLVFAFLRHLNAFERFARFSRLFERRQLDEVALAVPAFLLILMVLSLRHQQRLRVRLLSSEARERAASIAVRMDPLTGLANTLGFTEALDRICVDGASFCLIVIDLDGFKSLNDRHGHAAGDEALRCVGERLHRLEVSLGAICAGRIGGDEFGIILAGTQNSSYVAAKIMSELREPFVWDTRHLVRLSASLGIARSTDPMSDASAMIRRADTAMYRAKRAGGTRWCEDGKQPSPKLDKPMLDLAVGE